MTDETVTIGRDRQSSILLEDDEVSRVHCSIFVESSRVFLVDEGSSNGTYLNGTSISRAEVQKGDKIRIGKTQFEFNSFLQISIDQQDASPLTASPMRVSRVNEPSISARPTEQISQSDNDTDSVGVKFDVDKDSRDAIAVDPDPSQQIASQHFFELPNDERGFVYQSMLATSQTMDIDKMLHEVMELIFDWLPVDRGCVFLSNPLKKKANKLEIKYVKKRLANDGSEGASQLKMDLDKAIINYVASRKVGVLSPKVWSDHDQSIDSRQTPSVSNQAICVPLQSRDEVIGVMYVDKSSDSNSDTDLSEENLRTMLVMAQQLALGIENARFFQDRVNKERDWEFGEVTTFMEHRINNILQGINGGSHLLEAGLKSDNLELCDKGWEITRKNQAWIVELVNDLMVLGSPLELKPKQCDLAELVAQAAATVESNLSAARLACRLPPTGTPESVASVDRRSLKICLEHMIRLVADSASGSGSEIQFSIIRNERQLQLVIDHPGSPLQTVRTSPEGKEELHSTTLAVAQKIIQAHQGQITVRTANSSSPNSSQVILSLPLQA